MDGRGVGHRHEGQPGGRLVTESQEPVEPGEYIYQNISHELITKDLVVSIAVVEVVDGKSQGKRYGKISGGRIFIKFACS